MGADQAVIAERLRAREDAVAALIDADPALRLDVGVPAAEDARRFVRRAAGTEWIRLAEVVVSDAAPAAMLAAL